MTQLTTSTTAPLWEVDLSEVWARRARSHSAPLWLRVACFAEAYALPNGHRPLMPEQLHKRLDPTVDKPQISKAIAAAVRYGWLHPGSSARCLVLSRASLDCDCPATHRSSSP